MMMNPQVDDLIANAKMWQIEMAALRAIALDCMLDEASKWKQACYTYQGANVLIISGFKDSCFISFLKGTLLQDAEGLLVKPGENSQSAMMMKFTNIDQINSLKDTITAYIYEAIEIEKAGLKVDRVQSKDLMYCDEFASILEKNLAFKTAFEALTPGRQRAYNIFFSAAKQSATKISRIEKNIPRILNGIGLNDCTCGLSKRMPTCDGSHRNL